MIVRITAGYGVHLDDAKDFKRFKIVVELPRLEYERAQQAAAGLIEFESPEKAWGTAAALQERVEESQRATWRPEFDRMIDAARPYGWIKDDPLRIAAHVEWKAPD